MWEAHNENSREEAYVEERRWHKGEGEKIIPLMRAHARERERERAGSKGEKGMKVGERNGEGGGVAKRNMQERDGGMSGEEGEKKLSPLNARKREKEKGRERGGWKKTSSVLSPLCMHMRTQESEVEREEDIRISFHHLSLLCARTIEQGREGACLYMCAYGGEGGRIFFHPFPLSHAHACAR